MYGLVCTGQAVSGSLLAMLTNYATMVNNNTWAASPGMYVSIYCTCTYIQYYMHKIAIIMQGSSEHNEHNEHKTCLINQKIKLA